MAKAKQAAEATAREERAAGAAHAAEATTRKAAAALGARHAKYGALYDMHCHLDFASNAEEVAHEAAALGIGAFSCTVTPAGFAQASAALTECGHARVGLGLHPWWVADGRCGEAEIVQLEALAKGAARAQLETLAKGVTHVRFIGEVGLDFAGARGGGEARARQVAAFERALAACAGGVRVISLHAVRSAGAVLDALERSGALEQHACVFHWFSGTSDELTRAVRAGCFFSIGPRMFATKRGRAYARAVPADRLLLETDLPAHAGEPWSAAAWRAELEGALEALAAARGENTAQLAATLAQTSQRLLA